MRISSAAALLLLSRTLLVVDAFAPPSRSRRRVLFLSSTPTTSPETEEDSPFASFEDSLEEDDYAQTQPWQSKLEELLDPLTPLPQRQILLSELLGSNQEIRDSVQKALQDRNIDPLLTPNAKRLQDGTRAVARQLTNDILPNIAQTVQSRRTSSVLPSPQDLSKLSSRVLNALQSQAKRAVEEVQQDLADPSRIAQKVSELPTELAKEARNVFSEMPEGLEGPPYTVVEHRGDYEIRDYSGYTVASTNMNPTFGEPYETDLSGSGTAFNTLAAYLFGANQDSKTMEMTTPVTTTSLGEMRFYLKETEQQVDDNIPMPLTDDSIYAKGSVQILELPPARLAVRKFTGFVTDGEISRQKQVLLQALELDGLYEMDVPHGAKVPHVIFQYNPPYTVPIARRNEIAVPIRVLPSDDEPDAESLVSQWSVTDADIPSDVGESDQ